MKKTIWGNTIVKNEDRYIWFAIKSVIDYLDKVLIYDTGSNDKTVEIIKLLEKDYPQKIVFKEIGEVDNEGFTVARQQMLDETKSDWLLLLDGDEVWWKKGVEEILELINDRGDKLNAIVTPVINLVGDVYHYQEQEAGQYEIMDKKGHFNIRAINRKIPGLHIKNEYPLEGFYDKDNILIQNKGENELVFQTNPLMHFTHLIRSSVEGNVMQRGRKRKYELGIPFPKSFEYPEVFFETRLDIVLDPWEKMSKLNFLRSVVETPIRKVKRRLWKI